ncbi:MAG: hydroxyacid dehydrogenase [Sphingobacteriales bacterium]|nr:MAG: hydroxyacid dehydrogenase [Sphingobacteriales bacterium]
MLKQVLTVTRIDPVLGDFLEQRGYSINYQPNLSRQALLAEAAGFEGIITSTKITFDREMLDACTHLKWIGRMGSGMELIDLVYAREKDIFCCSSPDGNANAVAEQALGMYLSLQHNIFKSNTELKEGTWLRDENRGTEIEGKTAGIIGLGHNGYKFAEKLSFLGMKVLAYDIEQKEIKAENIIQVNQLEAIHSAADVISFHVPYNPITHHYFDHDFLERMQQPFVLLNLSRGKVVDQAALLEGLKNGKIKGAALDVWEKEPLHKMTQEMQAEAQELLAHPHFIGTTHIGGYSHEATYKMSLILKQKLEKYILNL